MTTLVIDLAGECCDVMGMGQVHLLRDNSEKVYIAGKTFALTELGDYQASRIAALLSEAIDHKPVTQANGHADREIPVPPEVLELAAERQNTRAHGNWESADRLRKKIESLGWQITDTGEGFQLSKKQV
jgi:cysteinyl-tRNA synthetase